MSKHVGWNVSVSYEQKEAYTYDRVKNKDAYEKVLEEEKWCENY